MMFTVSPSVVTEQAGDFTDLEFAVLRTALYADIFDYPLTLAELHHYLIGAAATLGEVWSALESDRLRARLVCLDGYYALRERAAIVPLRVLRRRQALQLWRPTRRWARWLGALPFVRMVAATGALAMDNVPAGDDVDLLVVTAPGRVWLTRALCVALVYAARVVGVRLCPNYVLSQAALAQAPRDLYIAHELAQMVPLVGQGLYAEMRAANPWTRFYLPHADGPLRREPEAAPSGPARWLQQLGEWILGGQLGDALERWEQTRKQRKFWPMAQASQAAQLDAERVKGHFDDHGRWILDAYRERLAALVDC